MTDDLANVKATFEAEGISISEWARDHGFNVITVYRVLSGRVKGKRGEAHKIAVALGIKEEPKSPRFRSVLAA